jgi:8-oxo-dGTP pyrophosphatase MutT (NUDIX family)
VTDALRAELHRRLAERETRRVAAADVDLRAAVVLLLRPPPGTERLADLEALFIQRAEAEWDPWSGHMALPGGRHDPDDEDLIGTALRELREETSLEPGRDALLGRLDEVHPRSHRLPSIAVTPFIGWSSSPGEVRENAELAGHLWVPVRALVEPGYRSTLRLERHGAVRLFPTVEYEGRTIWGLTFRIVREFLEVVSGEGAPRAAPSHPEDVRRGQGSRG